MTHRSDPLTGIPAPEAATPVWRILIVDDEPRASALTTIALATVRGYEVRVEQFPLRAQAVAREWRPDLIILDVRMPKLDGITLGKRLKADGCPADLMFVTSMTSEDSTEDGLEVSDQYITKPYRPREFLARVRAVLRRREPQSASGQAERAANDARPAIDIVSRVVRVPNGKVATLTPNELKLLLALLAGDGKPVSTQRLLQEVWGEELTADDYDARNSPRVQAHMCRLRRKIERNPSQPELILTIPRAGYCYVLTA
jgi:DNA-binding response OmpR family regulator